MPTLLKTKNGTYYAIFTYQHKRVWRSTYTQDREEAFHVMEELQKEFPNWKQTKILGFKDQLISILEGQNAPATISMYDLTFRKFAEIVGNRFLRSVTPYDVEVFKSRRLKVVSPATVSIDYRVLKTAFNKAVKFGIIGRNPFNEVKNVIIPEEEPVYLSAEEIAKLLEATKDAQLRAIIIIAICTAMRRGEIINLKWGSVDFTRGFLHLVNRPDFVLKGKRRRSVPLNKTATRLLETLGRRSDFVFCDAFGNRLLGDYVTKSFKKCVRRAGLSEKTHFHSLRHTGASLLVQMSVPLPFVQRILGHCNIRTTSRYTHESSQHLKDSVAKLDAIFPMDLMMRERSNRA